MHLAMQPQAAERQWLDFLAALVGTGKQIIGARLDSDMIGEVQGWRQDG